MQTSFRPTGPLPGTDGPLLPTDPVSWTWTTWLMACDLVPVPAWRAQARAWLVRALVMFVQRQGAVHLQATICHVVSQALADLDAIKTQPQRVNAARQAWLHVQTQRGAVGVDAADAVVAACQALEVVLEPAARRPGNREVYTPDQTRLATLVDALDAAEQLLAVGHADQASAVLCMLRCPLPPPRSCRWAGGMSAAGSEFYNRAWDVCVRVCAAGAPMPAGLMADLAPLLVRAPQLAQRLCPVLWRAGVHPGALLGQGEGQVPTEWWRLVVAWCALASRHVALGLLAAPPQAPVLRTAQRWALLTPWLAKALLRPAPTGAHIREMLTLWSAGNATPCQQFLRAHLPAAHASWWAPVLEVLASQDRAAAQAVFSGALLPHVRDAAQFVALAQAAGLRTGGWRTHLDVAVMLAAPLCGGNGWSWVRRLMDVWVRARNSLMPPVVVLATVKGVRSRGGAVTPEMLPGRWQAQHAAGIQQETAAFLAGLRLYGPDAVAGMWMDPLAPEQSVMLQRAASRVLAFARDGLAVDERALHRYLSMVTVPQVRSLWNRLRAGAHPVSDGAHPWLGGARWLEHIHKRDHARRFFFLAHPVRCCFAPGGGHWRTHARWLAQMWWDPCVVAFHVVNRGPSAPRAEGFVFANLGDVGGGPVLLVNGVYLQRQARGLRTRVLETLERSVAEPLGLRWMGVAARNGGMGPLPDGYAFERRVFRRWRPLVHHGQPVTSVYDDIGTLANASTDAGGLWWKPVMAAGGGGGRPPGS